MDVWLTESGGVADGAGGHGSGDALGQRWGMAPGAAPGMTSVLNALDGDSPVENSALLLDWWVKGGGRDPIVRGWLLPGTTCAGPAICFS